MSTTRQTLLLARREFLQRLQTRAFVVTMAILVGLILVAGPLVSAVADEEKPIRIGIVGIEPAGLDRDLEAAAAAFEATITSERFADLPVAEEALRSGDLDVALVDGRELVWHEDESFFRAQIIQSALTAGQRRAVLEEMEATPDQRARLQTPSELSSRTLIVPSPDEEARQVAAFLAVFVLYIAILVFGQFVAMGTVQEKQTRVIEVLLAKVRPTQVLAGKVLGIGALGLVQLVALGLAGLLTLTFVDSAEISLPSLGLEVIGAAILWFLLGYTLYAFVYAALGATVSRQEDLQTVLIAPLLLLLPGFFIAQIAAGTRESALARFGSLFPFWSPMIMPTRIATGEAAAWEVALSIGLVLLTIYALIRLGARVYGGGLLRTGGRVKLIEAWRSAGT